MLEIKEERNLIKRLFYYFGETYTAVFFLLFSALCYNFGLSAIAVIALSGALILTLLFSDKVNNIFAYVLYIPFFIESISTEDAAWQVYVPCIVAAAVAVNAFFISKIITERKKINLGGMFYPLLAMAAAMLLGGAAGNFNIKVFSLFSVLIAEIIILYLIAFNYTRDFSRFLAVVSVVGALLIFLTLASIYLKSGTSPELFFAAQNVNTAAIFITVGMAGCFYLGVRTKYDYIYALLSVLLFAAVITTHCRTMTFIAALILLAEYILFVVYSKKKIILVLIAALMISFIIGFAIINYEEVKAHIDKFIRKGTDSFLGAREILWKWCLEKFGENPFFGIGYVYGYEVPTIISFYPKLIMAHNTVLQWLTATGVIGTAVAAYFYIGKYYALFNGFNGKRIFHLLSILAIALSGTFDQSPTMDIFTVIITLSLVAAAEKTVKNGRFISDAF